MTSIPTFFVVFLANTLVDTLVGIGFIINTVDKEYFAELVNKNQSINFDNII